MLISKRDSESIKHYNDCKGFIEYSNDICENIEEYNQSKERKILILFDDIMADMLSNKKTSINSNRVIY